MRDKVWSEPKFDDFCGYLYTVNNSKMDVEGFIDSTYGKRLTLALLTRFKIEDNLDEAKRYYESIGLKRECHNFNDYYKRWSLLVPLKERKLYPLVIYLHGMGNSIEAEESMTGFPEIANREGFILATPQNTNSDRVMEMIDEIKKLYPIDSTRIYLAGFSQGANQAHSIYLRNPGIFSACATSGNDIFSPYDSFNIEYKAEEFEDLKKYRVPLFQIVGECEPFSYAPFNEYHENAPFRGKWGRPDTSLAIGKDPFKDPTRMTKTLKDASGKETISFIRNKEYVPNENENKDIWNLEKVNKRLELLNCKERDINTCLSYKDLKDNDLKKKIGIYGDTELIEYHYGYRHYTIGINDLNNKEVYRFVLIQNSPHWPPLTFGMLAYRFMKRFSRDLKTKELIIK